MTKKALCVGINTYPDGNNLNGCVNDAHAWASVLKDTFGFPAANVKVLLEQQATKAAIMAGLQDLLAGAQSGDVLVFTNSSHGTYVADSSGDEAYDEAICPFDCARGKSHLVLDDELRELFRKHLPAGVSFAVISDSCHSGTLTRAPEPDEPDHRKARFLEPRAIGLRSLADADRAKPKKPKLTQGDMKELLLSGCTQREYSWDATIDGKPHGAMTWAVLQTIADEGPQVTWATLHERVRSLLESRGFDQHPQLEGRPESKKKPIFS
jgi:hypothetical protein